MTNVFDDAMKQPIIKYKNPKLKVHSQDTLNKIEQIQKYKN